MSQIRGIGSGLALTIQAWALALDEGSWVLWQDAAGFKVSVAGLVLVYDFTAPGYEDHG